MAKLNFISSCLLTLSFKVQKIPWQWNRPVCGKNELHKATQPSFISTISCFYQTGCQRVTKTVSKYGFGRRHGNIATIRRLMSLPFKPFCFLDAKRTSKWMQWASQGLNFGSFSTINSQVLALVQVTNKQVETLTFEFVPGKWTWLRRHSNAGEMKTFNESIWNFQ